MISRRNFLKGASVLGVSTAPVSSVGAMALPEAFVMDSAKTHVPSSPHSGRPFNPVVTLNGWSLPWRMNNGVKEFHLVAEPVVREFAPGMNVNLWGYNGQSPGPTIEVVEGDRVRIFVTNKLPEPTSVHWHGQRLPNGMDGVAGLTQPGIPPGKTFVYEFIANRAGTFMYRPHTNELVQMAMGMMGFWVTHPRDLSKFAADRDFVFLLSAYDVDPGTYTPKVYAAVDFNLWTFNSRVFPGIDPMPVRKGDRVRVRVGNLTMTSHPIHLHGHEFEVSGTDGGWTVPGSRWPEVTTEIAAGQMRAIEFVATEPGDWAFHCNDAHHTLNAMSHNISTLIGVDQRAIEDKLSKLVPDYIAKDDNEELTGRPKRPIPENTLPMKSGNGPFGNVEMGGMFTTLKVRANQAHGDYTDPGWYEHPAGTVAYEWMGRPPVPGGH